ncbi:hypothetical protein JHK86_027700 [Glycine max]|nr:hypothetical protein JHK86_027700 [Glycine max]
MVLGMLLWWDGMTVFARGDEGDMVAWGMGVMNAVEALSNVKAIHVVAGDYTTFVVFDDGDVYSFGCGQSASLGHNAVGNDE